MKHFIFILFFLTLPMQMHGQNHYEIKDSSDVAVIPFKLIGNLIIIKVNINGNDLNLIFDTGVKQTILLNLANKDAKRYKKIKKKLFIGVGNEKHNIEAVKTIENHINLGNKILSRDAEVYLITNAEFTFSEKMGIPIFGFIGGDLIKNFILRIDYRKKKLFFYQPEHFQKSRWKKYVRIPLQIHKDKPYLHAFIRFSKKSKQKKITLLIDTGNSDPIWIFQSDSLKVPGNKLRIKDYFGLGLNGDIKGERIKTYKLSIFSKFHFKRVITGLPNQEYYNKLIENNPFDGIIGGEILKRFKIYFDYQNSSLYLKKRWWDYHKKFPFNESGLYLSYQGKIPIRIKKTITNIDTRELSSGGNNILIDQSDFVYEYKFFDKIVVHYVREGSPADKAGFAVGDVILEINGESVYNYKLNELEEKFLYKSGKNLRFLINRNGLLLKLKMNVDEQL
jgi:hypothetical protein